MRNPFRTLLGLLPARPLEVGTVIASVNGVVKVELPSGAIVSARGSAGVGGKVFIRDAAVEGDAPNLPVEVIEI